MKKKLQVLAVNLVTTIRMVGIFALVPIYLTYGGVALGLTNVACFLTDFIDGKMARHMKASTFFGSLYDSVSDKAFLAVNFIILCSINPIALIPIILELSIAGIQTIKYKKNYNVKSNMFGKVKMWIAGIAMTLSNFLIDIESIKYLGNSIIDKIAKFSDSSLVEKTLIPVILAEIVTLVSYIMEMDKKEEITPVEEVKKEVKHERTIEDIKKDKEENRKLYNELVSLKEMLFNPTFYEEHKEENGLQLIREKIKKKS